jgi:lactate dehydrogenase-like 2-hydroxyacid dehydrogenase
MNARPTGTPPPDDRRVPALLVNGSFQDVLAEVGDALAEARLAIASPADVAAMAPAARRRLLESVHVVFGPGPFTRADIKAAQRLRVISLASSGYESLDVEAATAHGIVVTHAPTRAGTESVADLTIALLLAVARQIPQLAQRLREGEWQRPLGAAVWRKTLGIVGFGRIGAAVARRARGFEMEVLTLAHHADDPRARELGVGCVPLDELLRRSDFVSLHGRYSPESHHLIGRAQLRAMRSTAYLINTARPGLVDQAALLDALRQGWIAGAALDVYEGEPDPDTPFARLPNVVVTPHLGNRTREGVIDVVRHSIANAAAVLRGERPVDVVNPSVYEWGVR